MSASMCLNLAKKLGLHKSVFLTWVSEHENEHLTSEQIFQQFGFMPEEEVYALMHTLVDEGFMVDGYQNGRFKLLLNRDFIRQKTGVQLPVHRMAKTSQEGLPSAPPSSQTLDSSLTPFLKRFKGEAGILNEKLKEVKQSSSELIAYAIDQGLTPEGAQLSFEKFFSYIQSDPQKFYNRDLNSYWAFWVSNSRERNRTNQSFASGGKQSAIEENNRLVIQSVLGNDDSYL